MFDMVSTELEPRCHRAAVFPEALGQNLCPCLSQLPEVTSHALAHEPLLLSLLWADLYSPKIRMLEFQPQYL